MPAHMRQVAMLSVARAPRGAGSLAATVRCAIARIGVRYGSGLLRPSRELQHRPSVYCRTRLQGSEKEVQVAGVAYVSRVRVELVEGRIRRAYLPAEEEPVMFGVHSEVAEHYGVSPDAEEPHASTLDYLVAAAGG